jgi:hypothetical protein
LQHSPSSVADPKVLNVDHGFVLGERLCEDVCHHFLGWAVFHHNLFLLDSLPNKMIPYIKVFGVSVILVIFCKMNCSSVVAI